VPSIAEIGFVSILVAKSVHKGLQDSALPMVAVDDAHFLGATRAPETSFSVLPMEVASGVRLMDVRSRQWVDQACVLPTAEADGVQ